MRIAFLIAILAGCSCSPPVASDACSPRLNQHLLDLLNSGQRRPVDNVMVCGTTTGPSFTFSGGARRHQFLPLRVVFPDGTSKSVQVVINDDLDGIVSAPQGAAVTAYGQAFFHNTGDYAAGIHDVHCSTHRGADDGWVIINGQKYPKHC